MNNIKPPSKKTLDRYGLSLEEYTELLERQKYKCGICGKDPGIHSKTGRLKLAIDHEHIKNWNKLDPNERKKYVRGLLCTYDNLFVANKNLSLVKAEQLVKYLKKYHDENKK